MATIHLKEFGSLMDLKRNHSLSFKHGGSHWWESNEEQPRQCLFLRISNGIIKRFKGQRVTYPSWKFMRLSRKELNSFEYEMALDIIVKIRIKHYIYSTQSFELFNSRAFERFACYTTFLWIVIGQFIVSLLNFLFIVWILISFLFYCCS